MSELISEKEFDDVWCPILKPSGDLLWFEDVRDESVQHIWIIVESGDDADGNWYAAPGFYIVNNIDYIMTKNPWTDITRDAIYFSMIWMMTMSAESASVLAVAHECKFIARLS